VNDLNAEITTVDFNSASDFDMHEIWIHKSTVSSQFQRLKMMDDLKIRWSEASNINEWKRLLAEIKNIKLNTNNNKKQYIHQRCYQVTNNIYGNPKSFNSS